MCAGGEGGAGCLKIVATIHRTLPDSFDWMLKGMILGKGWGDSGATMGWLYEDLERKSYGK